MQLHYLTYFWLLILVFVSGCTLEVSDSSTDNAITESDLLAARQIIGETISSDNSGVVLSINDALTIIAQTGTSPSAPIAYAKDRSGIGNESDIQTGFNQQSGIFTVSFQREVQDPLFSKSIVSKLIYLYQNKNGDIVANPNQNMSAVSSIQYTANHDGEIQTLRKQSSFISDDSLFISGFESGQSKSIDGVHNRGGSVQFKPFTDNTIQRFYDLRIRFLNITSPKQLSSDGQTPNIALNGNMAFELELRSTEGSTTNRTSISGTLEHNGDGTALLRFKNNPELYLVDLKNGESVNLNEAFKGQVLSVDINQQSVSLASGITVYINENTTFENRDFSTLQSVKNSLSNNEPIYTKGEGTVDNNKFIASSINFEVGQPQLVSRKEILEFEEIVSETNPVDSSFRLANQVTVQLIDSTQVNENGDYTSLNQLKDALQRDITVIAEGRAMPSNSRLLIPDTEGVTFKRIGNSN
ncbi:hypothetical protein LX73_2166 [Fodinibius salinus]|uniref:Uncharacterized protein n=1 Tax=Fodinibius salinus TaxID=860790 RepID=A0A5D3YHV7_9BACT|nr:hypothetical protein [Fodinibius salinus]TYP92799.1 hypothetical protein LX73_2166 [Fodinibius salinus]